MMPRIAAMLAAILATAAVVDLSHRWLRIAPLILFLTPVAVFLRIGGIRLALAAAVIGAVVGDYLFVEPVHQVTVHAQGLRLLLVFVIATGLTALAMHMTHRRAS